MTMMMMTAVAVADADGAKGRVFFRFDVRGYVVEQSCSRPCVLFLGCNGGNGPVQSIIKSQITVRIPRPKALKTVAAAAAAVKWLINEIGGETAIGSASEGRYRDSFVPSLRLLLPLLGLGGSSADMGRGSQISDMVYVSHALRWLPTSH